MTKKKLLIVVGAVLGVFLIGFMFYTMNKGSNHPQFQLEDGKTGTLKSEAKASSEKKLPSDPVEAAKATLEQSDKEITSYKDEIKEKLKVMMSNVGGQRRDDRIYLLGGDGADNREGDFNEPFKCFGRWIYF